MQLGGPSDWSLDDHGGGLLLKILFCQECTVGSEWQNLGSWWRWSWCDIRVQPEAILMAWFCTLCILVQLVSDSAGPHIGAAYSSAVLQVDL